MLKAVLQQLQKDTTEVDASGQELENSDIPALIEAINKNLKLTKINFSGNHFYGYHETEVYDLIAACVSHPTLESVDLSSNQKQVMENYTYQTKGQLVVELRDGVNWLGVMESDVDIKIVPVLYKGTREVSKNIPKNVINNVCTTLTNKALKKQAPFQAEISELTTKVSDSFRDKKFSNELLQSIEKMMLNIVNSACLLERKLLNDLLQALYKIMKEQVVDVISSSGKIDNDNIVGLKYAWQVLKMLSNPESKLKYWLSKDALKQLGGFLLQFYAVIGIPLISFLKRDHVNFESLSEMVFYAHRYAQDEKLNKEIGRLNHSHFLTLVEEACKAVSSKQPKDAIIAFQKILDKFNCLIADRQTEKHRTKKNFY